MFELEGKVKEVFDEKVVGKGLRIKEFVVTTEGKYPQDLKFECLQDKIGQLEGIAPEEPVKVKFDLRGREWKGNYFVNLSAWQVQRGGGESAPAESAPEPSPEDRPDDIPF